MGEHLETPAFVGYYGLLQLQARTFELLTRDFEAQTGMPVSWYELLACLQGCDDEGQRMNELADSLLISRGGATKLVARLEDAGYVERYTPKDDRRATYARITAKGETAVNAAHPVQLGLVEEHFGRHVNQRDLADLNRIAQKVLSGIGAECTWLDELVESQAATESAQATG